MNFSLKVKQVQYPAEDVITLRFDKIRGIILPGQHLSSSREFNGEKLSGNFFLSSPYVDDDIAIAIRTIPVRKMVRIFNGSCQRRSGYGIGKEYCRF